MEMNWMILLISAVIPMAVGMVYYGPLFGNAWMAVNGFKKEDLEDGNMALILGLSFFLSFVLAIGLSGMVIHQSSVVQLMANDLRAGSQDAQDLLAQIMATYGDAHKSFKHGALHGGIAAILIVLPVLAINALFERRGGKYIGIHFGYWFITLTLMGGVICHFW